MKYHSKNTKTYTVKFKDGSVSQVSALTASDAIGVARFWLMEAPLPDGEDPVEQDLTVLSVEPAT